MPTTTRSAPASTSAAASLVERTPPAAWTRAGDAAATARATSSGPHAARPGGVQVDDVDDLRTRRGEPRSISANGSASRSVTSS